MKANHVYCVLMLLIISIEACVNHNSSAINMETNESIVNVVSKDTIDTIRQLEHLTFTNPRKEDTLDENIILAAFPGGEDSLNQFIKRYLIRSKGAEGKGVIITVDVDTTGNITRIYDFEEIHNCLDCKKNAIDLIKKMPKFRSAYTADKKGKMIQKINYFRTIKIIW